MRVAALTLALALSGCSPAVRVGLKRCPTMLAAMTDFTIGSTLLGMGVLAYNVDRTTRAFTFSMLGMATYVATGVAECKR